MGVRIFASFLIALAAATALAGETAVLPVRQGVKPVEGYRYLDAGSWIITEAHLRTNGSPATIKRKIAVTTQPSSGQRMVEESRWSGRAFEAGEAAQPLADADRR